MDLSFDLDLWDPISGKISNHDVTGFVNSCFSYFGCSPFSISPDKKAGSHRYAPTDELKESAKIDMCLCNPAIKLPVAAQQQPTVSVLSDRYSIKIGNSAFRREPITNWAGPDSSKAPFSRPIQIYQHDILLSICQKHVDGFCRQRNCSPGFYYLASSALSSISAIWQAMHTCMIRHLASRACTYRFCKFVSRIRMDGSETGKQCSDPDPRDFRHKLVGNKSQTQRSHFVRATRFHAFT